MQVKWIQTKRSHKAPPKKALTLNFSQKWFYVCCMWTKTIFVGFSLCYRKKIHFSVGFSGGHPNYIDHNPNQLISSLNVTGVHWNKNLSELFAISYFSARSGDEMWSGGILIHSSSHNCFSWAIFLEGLVWTALLRSSHTILIGLRYGLWLGHSKRQIFSEAIL